MLIRPLQPQDHSDWLRLRRAVWPDCSEAMHACEMEGYADGPDTRAVLVLVREEGRLGGFVEVSVRDRVDGSMAPRVAYLEAWFVEPDLRGQGCQMIVGEVEAIQRGEATDLWWQGM